ncbi:MAG TPA: Ig-like domain-containing protein, partial [Pyrinomonadaceae bacterium]|nr:Ig-like domain-containing protein [Pyrinomonadaceae bacterium]
MKQLSPRYTSGNLRVFFACLLSFNIFLAPIGAIAATYKRPVADHKSETKAKATAADDVFAKPLEAAGSSLPGPKAAPAPQPLTPAFGTLAVTMDASPPVLPAAGDTDGDHKADPGETIKYTVKLDNMTGGVDALGVTFTDTIDSHTVLNGTVNSTPVAFDKSVVMDEDPGPPGVSITISGQDPDGNNLTFRNPATNLPFGASTATGHGTLGAFSGPDCTTTPGICTTTATYTPTLDYNGPDSFTFRVFDGTANSNEDATVSITVNAVNDAPTFTVPPSNPPAVNEDSGAASVAGYITNVKPGPAVEPSNEDGQTVSFVIDTNSNPGLFLTAPALNVVGPSYPKQATLTYTPKADQNGTATITYHAVDNGSGVAPNVNISATQSFTITVNAVNDPPVVTNKNYNAQANMKITGLGTAAGTSLLTGITDADSGVNGCNPTFAIKAGSVSATSPAGGTISNLNLSTGTFDFDPPPGVTGNVTFTYVVSDNGCPGTADSAPVTVTVAVAGPVIWFVQTTANPSPPAAAAGDGRLSNPFNRLDSAMTAMGVNANQRIFVFTGSTPTVAGQTVTLAGNNTLANQALARVQAQWLIGQGVVAANFDTFFGISPPANTIARPTLGADTTGANALRPTIQGTVTMKENTVVQGLNINTSAGGAKGITASGLTAGTSGSLLTIKDVNVTSAGGNAVDIAGSSPTNNSVEYTTSDAANFPISLASTTGIALSVVNTTIGPNGLNFKSVSANGGSKGIVLNNTGAGPLNIVGTGTTAGSGGTIQTTTSNGIELKTAQNITLKNMTITGNGTSQTVAGSSSSCGGDLATGNNLSCVANIYMQTVTNANFDRLSVTNSKQQGINGNAVNGLSITNSTITGNGDEGFEDGILLQNQSGTFTFTSNTVTDNRAGQLYVANLSGTMTLNASSSTIGRTGAGTADGQQSVLLHLMGTSNSTINATTLTMNNNFFVSGTNVYTNAFQLNADNGGPTVTGHLTSSSLDKYAAGVFVNAGGTANVTFDVMNNATMTNSNLQAINYTILGGGAAITAKITGTISGNTINGCAPTGSNCHGIDFNAGENHNGEFHIKVDQNDIQGTGSGILMLAGGAAAAGSAKAHLKITRNTIHNPGFATGRAAIELQAAVTSANPNISICTDIGGAALQNVISGAWSTGSSQSGIFLRQRFSAANSWVLPGYGGPANNSGQQVEAY